MMIRDPRKKTEHLALTQEQCYLYSGAVHYDGRKMIPGTGVFTIGDQVTSKNYFEGRVDRAGHIRWVRLSSGKLTKKIRGTFNESCGRWDIQFDKDVMQPGEEITFSYEWRPHPLHGAMILVKVNNEERLVPIEELQQALWGYLKDD